MTATRGCITKGVVIFWQVAIAATVTILVAPIAGAIDQGNKTRELVAVLQSDASVFEKARACQQLGEIGTADAVPVLAGLLTDPALSAYARSGLEGIPDPSAAAALREAAQKLKAPLLAGVVNSLGVLRDTQAIPLLGKLALEPSSGVVTEAFMALGNISNPGSIRLLKQAITSGQDSVRSEAAAGCLLAADRQRIGGELKQASSLYDLVRKAKVPTAYRVGATRGAILLRKGDRVSFLIGQLRSAEPAIRNVALLTIREIPDDALATALNAEVIHSPPALQGQLVLAIGDCHNARSLAVIQVLASSPSPEVRKQALTVLGRLGPAAAPALLAALPMCGTAEEKSIVLSGMRALEGSSVDDVLLRALASATSPERQIQLIGVLDSRGVAKALPDILKLAAAHEKNVSIAALSALRALAGLDELATIVALAQSSTDEEVRDAAESALVGICSRAGDEASETILKELKQATKSSERNSWIRVLARVGYDKALPAIVSAVSDPDPAVADNAVTQLGHWPNPAPMEILLKTLDSGATPILRKRALASVIDLATTASDEAQTPESTIVTWVQRANSVSESIEDKRRILGLLGRLRTAESLRLLMPYLDDPTLRAEAASAVVQIGPTLARGENAEMLKLALEKIAATAGNDNLRKRALELGKTITLPGAPASLFDGRSLQGWEGDTNVWRVRDGLLVGGSMSGNPRNEFLATVRSYTNFLLQLEYKLVGTEGFINSGVQFRSVRLKDPPNEMSGYQADIGAGYSGCLYDESRRNAFLARASQETVQRLEKTNDWNGYQIRCEGAHIQLWLNGEKTVDYSEPEGAMVQRGLIGLQIHGGNKAEVYFRNVFIVEY